MYSVNIKTGYAVSYTHLDVYKRQSTSYPRVPRDSFAQTRACFLIIQLSGYGQFMLSTSFLPLHGLSLIHICKTL